MAGSTDRKRAQRNRTMVVSRNEAAELRERIVGNDQVKNSARDQIIRGDDRDVQPKLKSKSFHLLFADPPYNLTKKFGIEKFNSTSSDMYEAWLDTWLTPEHVHKPTRVEFTL